VLVLVLVLVLVGDAYGGQRGPGVGRERGGGAVQHRIVRVQPERVRPAPAVADLPGDVPAEHRARPGPRGQHGKAPQLRRQQPVGTVQQFAQRAYGVAGQLQPFQQPQPEQHGQLGDLVVREPVVVAGAAPQLQQPLFDALRNPGQPLRLPRRDVRRVGERHGLGDRGALHHGPEAGRDTGVDDLREQRPERLGLGVRGAGHHPLLPLSGEFETDPGAVGRLGPHHGGQFAHIVGGELLPGAGPVEEGVDELGGLVSGVLVEAAEGGRLAGADDGGYGRHGDGLGRARLAAPGQRAAVVDERHVAARHGHVLDGRAVRTGAGGQAEGEGQRVRLGPGDLQDRLVGQPVGGGGDGGETHGVPVSRVGVAGGAGAGAARLLEEQQIAGAEGE
jgi:hypothetical protein